MKTARMTRLLAAALALAFAVDRFHTAAHLAFEDHHDSLVSRHEKKLYLSAPRAGDAADGTVTSQEIPSHDPHSAGDHRKDAVSTPGKKVAAVLISAAHPAKLTTVSDDSARPRAIHRPDSAPPEPSPPSPRRPRAPPHS